MIVLYKSATDDSSSKWVARRWDRAVYLSVSCRQEVRRNTDDLLQLINVCVHVSDRVQNVVKNLVHYNARHFFIYVQLQHMCAVMAPPYLAYSILLFICSVKTLCVVHFAVLCVHTLKPTHGEQRDFLQMRCSRGAALSCCRGACCSFHLLKGKGRLAQEKKKNRHFNLGFSVQACNIY